jgi:epoxyqueuosine reductase
MPDLERLGSLTEDAFREFYKGSPISRARYGGFLRNVATAMGNTGDPRYRPLLARLAESPDPAVAEHARWALEQLE